MKDAKKALGFLGPSHLGFIERELGVNADAIKAMSDGAFSALYDKLADIEVEEVCKAGDGDVSERGSTAADIVTIIGNELYRPKVTSRRRRSNHEKRHDAAQVSDLSSV